MHSAIPFSLLGIMVSVPGKVTSMQGISNKEEKIKWYQVSIYQPIWKFTEKDTVGITIIIIIKFTFWTPMFANISIYSMTMLCSTILTCCIS